MDLDATHVQHLAKLTRLSLPEGEASSYVHDLGAILGYVRKLTEIDTDGVPETAHADAGVNVLCEDDAQPCDPDLRRRLIAAFPRRNGDLLEVQAVFENRTE